MAHFSDIINTKKQFIRYLGVLKDASAALI